MIHEIIINMSKWIIKKDFSNHDFLDVLSHKSFYIDKNRECQYKIIIISKKIIR